MLQKYDVIVVGGGHAGNEAAAAAANLGSKVLMITMNMNTIGQMSCNPAMGGIAKGQIIREIDAMGGYSGIVSDKSAIQFRMLNRSKGPAMWSPRSQNDRMRFAEEWRLMLEQTPNVDFWQDMVKGITTENNIITGVITSMGQTIKAKAVVLTNGTFLNGLIHLGDKQFGGGRAGESASFGITEQLVELGFESGRMKTGTPPRIDGRTLDYSLMEEQHGDENPSGFSYLNLPKLKEQRPCHITYTNPIVHEILQEGFEKSPMFTGRIQGLGPRYCPSIEDKITRFSERTRHQIFVEPEGWNTVEIYVNGFSTSLPEEVQQKALREVPGFKHCKMFRPGYAIEYDYFPPTQLKHTLETKLVAGLFFAGQINGTTGYEEAASQGMMAGINAHNYIFDKPEYILGRNEAYIGVLIDDLITKGTDEPYRMFTSRAEYRILLRQDNADVRLTEKSNKIGLASNERLEAVNNKIKKTDDFIKYIKNYGVTPDAINPLLIEKNTAPLKQQIKLGNVITRPQLSLSEIQNVIPEIQDYISDNSLTEEMCEQTEIILKYEGYIQKEQDVANKLIRLENISIPPDMDYKNMKSISIEAAQKLEKIKPTTIGQASRISGINPSDISVLLIHMGR